MSATTISEGHWVYRAAGWMSPFTATDRRTGQTHQTDATNIHGARAGHQRYTKAFAA